MISDLVVSLDIALTKLFSDFLHECLVSHTKFWKRKGKRSPDLDQAGDLAYVPDLGFHMPRSLQAEKCQVFKMIF